MTQDAVSVLSTMPHRLYRDIRLSNDIGRDSPMDPFVGKDMTLLFGKKKDSSTGLMYFAQKPLRKTQGSVVMSKQPDPRKGMSIYRPISQVTYDVKYAADCEKAIAFTKGKRFPDPDARTKRLEERKQVLLSRKQFGDNTPIPLMEPEKKYPELPPRDIVEKPDLSHAPLIGKYAGRGWDKDDGSPPRKKLTKWTMFPWEKKGRPTSPSSPTAVTQTTVPDPTVEDGVDLTAPSPPPPARAQSANPTKSRPETEEEEEEKWLKERKGLLARYGLSGGGTRRERLRRRARPKGADFSATTGRDAPVFDLAQGKQLVDLLYLPKYDVTSRERKKYADVGIGKYAGRATNAEAPHIQSVNRVLEPNRLQKFHQKKLQREAESALAMPASNGAPKAVSEKPLTGADEFTTNPRTLHAPVTVVTRAFKGAPDITLYSDRPNEPLSAVLGGDKKRYERILRKQDREQQRPSTVS